MKISAATRKTIEENAEALRAATMALEKAKDEYNRTRSDLKDTLQGAYDELMGEFEEKSEKWQESEKGETAMAWLEEIETKIGDIEDDVEFDLPDPDDVVGFNDQPE